MADTRRGTRPVTLIAPLSAQGLDRFAHFAIYHLPDGHLDILGAGGMGATYRAFDLQLERSVALKVIHPQHFYHPDVRARFLREAKAAARLQHPNIAGVLYQGEENGICFYAMELVTGEDLETYVHRVGPLDPVAALQICHQVLLALDAAYQVQLLHRDLKPANIMLTRYHDRRIPHVKVIDFGLAKFMHEVSATLVTRAGFMGTPAYASPEQCQEIAVDCRSDLYSLGATLWFLLTGRELFEGSTLSIIQAHVNQVPDYSVLPMEPGPVHYVLQRLLAKKPEDRPETPMHAVHDVEYAMEALGGPAMSTLPPVEPKLPPPGPPPTLVLDEEPKEAKPASKTWIWGGIAAAVLILATGAAAYLWFGTKGRNEASGSPVAQQPEPLPASAVVHPEPAGVTSPPSSVNEPVSAPVVEKPSQEISSAPPVPPAGPPAEKTPSMVSEPVLPPPPVPPIPAPPLEAASKVGAEVAKIQAVTPPPVVAAVSIPAVASPPLPAAPPVPEVRPEAVGQRTNTLGMKFVPIPFLGGDNWICIWETRLKDYNAFAVATKRMPKESPSWKDPGFVQTDNDPVVFVSVEDGEAFCHWLTEKERAEGKIASYQIYRLPTRLELDAAVGHVPPDILNQILRKYPNKVLPRQIPPPKYPWGTKWPPEPNLGNFADSKAYYAGLLKRAIPRYEDGFPATSPVGSFSPNTFGIYDLIGNAWEMNASPDGRDSKWGGSWSSYLETDFSLRDPITIGASQRDNATGFRCVLVEDSSSLAYTPPDQGAPGPP